MITLALDRDTILRRLNGIQEELRELQSIRQQTFAEFSKGVGYKLAQFHLHRALEGVFHIGSHILSRIPGGQVTEYKAIARKLGEYGIVPTEFANTRLVEMAGYRNRLVHFYADITPEEIYTLLHDHLGDFETLLMNVKLVLGNPQKFGLV